MARGGCLGQKRKTKNKVQLQTKGSDESDEDYNVDEDEEFNESEDDCSFAEDESEEILGLDEEEEDEWLEKKVKKAGKAGGWPRGQKGLPTRKKNGGVKQRRKQVVCSTEEEDSDNQYSYGAKRQKKNTVSYKEEEDDELGVLHSPERDEDFDEKLRTQAQNPRKENFGASHYDNPREKDHVSYQEKEDGDYDDSFEDDDEEFTPGEVFVETTRNPVKKRPLRRKNKPKVLEKCRDEALTSQKKISNKGWVWGRKKRRKLNLNSDSDFVSSGSSDFEYTVSEEEREQVREAAEFCRRLTTRPRSLRSLKNRKKEEILPSKGKRLGKKGKQKEVEMKKIEVGTQVCGICLSEEGKRTVRGVLNCCSHYFCFACIMEWSKVESRCPLCKQRFATISRTAREEGGRDLRDAVFPVPERDQVYQPTEEELRGYLDPYENVLCTECLQGGDDALMLLCDLCDSPAHTYCVGLGREVPEGNWYCDGCRPTALASSNAQALDPVPDHGGSNNLSAASPPVTAVRETFDLNEVYVPDTPLTQEYGQLQSPRHSVGHFQINSPLPGSGAFTLFDRRRIQRQIHQFLMHRHPDRSAAAVPVPTINLFGSPIVPARATPPNIFLRERLPDYNTPSSVFSSRISRFVGEPHSNQASTSTDHFSGGLLLSEFSGLNTRIGGGLGHSQLHPCSGASNTRPTSSTSPYQFREATVPSRTLQFNR